MSFIACVQNLLNKYPWAKIEDFVDLVDLWEDAYES